MLRGVVGVLRLVLCGVLVSAAVAGCGSGEGTPRMGPDKASCDSGLAPADVHLAANTCNVDYYVFPDPGARHFPQIPHNYAAQSVAVDLYIEGAETCGIGPGLCGVDDNRPFVPQDSPDPGADPSRTRVHMILDFASGTVTVRISPSCRIHAVSVGVNSQKECFAPKRTGEETSLAVSEPRPGTVGIDLTVIQTNYPTVANFAQVHNYWEFTPHPNGTIDISGTGTNFPDFDVIHYGRVICANRGTHLSNVYPPPPFGQRSYDCHEVGLGDQTNPGPTAVTNTWLARMNNPRSNAGIAPGGDMHPSISVRRVGSGRVYGSELTGAELVAGVVPASQNYVDAAFDYRASCVAYPSNHIYGQTHNVRVFGEVEARNISVSDHPLPVSQADVANGIESRGTAVITFIARWRPYANSAWRRYMEDSFTEGYKVVNGHAVASSEQGYQYPTDQFSRAIYAQRYPPGSPC
jgi:hypothetical protein